MWDKEANKYIGGLGRWGPGSDVTQPTQRVGCEG